MREITVGLGEMYLNHKCEAYILCPIPKEMRRKSVSISVVFQYHGKRKEKKA